MEDLVEVRGRIRGFINLETRVVKSPRICLNWIYQILVRIDGNLNQNLKQIRQALYKKDQDLERHINQYYIHQNDIIEENIGNRTEYEILKEIQLMQATDYEKITRLFYLIDIVQRLIDNLGQQGVEGENNRWLVRHLSAQLHLSEIFQLIVDTHCQFKKSNGSKMLSQPSSVQNIATRKWDLYQLIYVQSQNRKARIHDLQEELAYLNKSLLADQNKIDKMKQYNRRRTSL